MIPLVYAFFVLGSFSAGYLVIRTGFPSAQTITPAKKISAGYLVGAIIFGTPIILINYFGINEEYYALLSLALLSAFFAIMLTKRIAFKETDPLTFKKEKKKTIEPQIKPIEEKPLKNKQITFEQGLMVKTKDEEKGKQVFKEKGVNIQSASSNKNASEEKNAALERLRKFAQEIKKNPQKKKSEDGPEEIEEDLLNNLSDIDTKEEEEY